MQLRGVGLGLDAVHAYRVGCEEVCVLAEDEVVVRGVAHPCVGLLIGADDLLLLQGLHHEVELGQSEPAVQLLGSQELHQLLVCLLGLGVRILKVGNVIPALGILA